MFTARKYDWETGNYYYRMRYYKPEIGRFLQPDPIGYFAGMNLYTYCGNNPTNWIDPWGLDTLGIHADPRGLGHAWISYTDDNGTTHTYGLYDIGRAKGYNRIPITDVVIDIDLNHYFAGARYYDLSLEQQKKWQDFLSKKHTYNRPWITFTIPTNNCASFASDAIRMVIGEDVDADSWFGFETPQEVFESILKLEKADPTSKLSPTSDKESDSSRSSSSSSSFLK